MSNKETILKCADVNFRYMRLPAGSVDGYRNLVDVYQRIARQSLAAAQAWNYGSPCPSHEPAVDSFWWGVTAWAEAFGRSIGVDINEWNLKFVVPHYEFAEYLRPKGYSEPLPMCTGDPADVILKLDALWMEQVVKLTAKWGLFSHLKDMPALTEARILGIELQNRGTDAYKAYLRSDLTFFEQLFKNFEFVPATNQRLFDWLAKAKEAI